jgi:hypothetical protein
LVRCGSLGGGASANDLLFAAITKKTQNHNKPINFSNEQINVTTNQLILTPAIS